MPVSPTLSTRCVGCGARAESVESSFHKSCSRFRYIQSKLLVGGKELLQHKQFFNISCFWYIRCIFRDTKKGFSRGKNAPIYPDFDITNLDITGMDCKWSLSSYTPKGRPGMSEVSPLSGITGLSFDSTLLSPLLFFCLLLLPFLSYLFLPAGPFF